MQLHAAQQRGGGLYSRYTGAGSPSPLKVRSIAAASTMEQPPAASRGAPRRSASPRVPPRRWSPWSPRSSWSPLTLGQPREHTDLGIFFGGIYHCFDAEGAECKYAACVSTASTRRGVGCKCAACVARHVGGQRGSKVVWTGLGTLKRDRGPRRTIFKFMDLGDTTPQV